MIVWKMVVFAEAKRQDEDVEGGGGLTGRVACAICSTGWRSLRPPFHPQAQHLRV